MLTAYIGIQHRGRVFLTIREDGKELSHEEVSCKKVAWLKINALQEARGEEVRVTVETNL